MEIVIISTLGENAKTVISPQFSIPFALMTLGHFAEDQAIHYVCLTALNHSYRNSSVGRKDIYEKRANEQSQWAGHDMDNGESNRDEGRTNEESQGIAHEMDNAKSSEEVRSIEDLPNEVLEIIIDFTLT